MMARTSKELPPSPEHRREEQVPGGSGREQQEQEPKVGGWEGFRKARGHGKRTCGSRRARLKRL